MSPPNRCFAHYAKAHNTEWFPTVERKKRALAELERVRAFNDTVVAAAVATRAGTKRVVETAGDKTLSGGSVRPPPHRLNAAASVKFLCVSRLSPPPLPMSDCTYKPRVWCSALSTAAEPGTHANANERMTRGWGDPVRRRL